MNLKTGVIGSDGLIDNLPYARVELEKYMDTLDLTDEAEHNRHFMIPSLRKAQDLFGYLPESVQLFVANRLKLHLSKVYGVVSFYSYFRTKPSGKYKISVCCGTACHVKGSSKMHDTLKTKVGLEEGQDTTKDMLFTVEKVSCVGACGLAPVMLVNEDVHGQLTSDDATRVVEQISKKEKIR